MIRGDVLRPVCLSTTLALESHFGAGERFIFGTTAQLCQIVRLFPEGPLERAHCGHGCGGCSEVLGETDAFG